MYTHYQKYGTDIYNFLCYYILGWCDSPDNSAYKITSPTHTEHPNFVSNYEVTPISLVMNYQGGWGNVVLNSGKQAWVSCKHILINRTSFMDISKSVKNVTKTSLQTESLTFLKPITFACPFCLQYLVHSICSAVNVLHQSPH